MMHGNFDIFLCAYESLATMLGGRLNYSVLDVENKISSLGSCAYSAAKRWVNMSSYADSKTTFHCKLFEIKRKFAVFNKRQ